MFIYLFIYMFIYVLLVCLLIYLFFLFGKFIMLHLQEAKALL